MQLKLRSWRFEWKRNRITPTHFIRPWPHFFQLEWSIGSLQWGDQVMWCQIHCLQANVIWNILGWLPRRSFRLKKLPQILINLIKGPFFFTFKLITGQRLEVRVADVDFMMRLGLPANMPRKQAKSPGLLPWKGKAHRLHSLHIRAANTNVQDSVHWWVTVVWCRWQFGTAHPREKAPTSGQII